MVALNFDASPCEVRLEGRGSVLISTHLDRAGALPRGPLSLRGDEGLVIRLEG
jgi:hypothetical protein